MRYVAKARYAAVSKVVVNQVDAHYRTAESKLIGTNEWPPHNSVSTGARNRIVRGAFGSGFGVEL